MGLRKRGIAAGTGNPVPQAGGRSRSRGMQAVQGWSDTGGVPIHEPRIQGPLHTTAWQVQRQPEPVAEHLLINTLPFIFDTVVFQFHFA